MSQPAFARFTARLSDELAALRREGRDYAPNVVSTPQGPRVTLGGRSCVNLCSNNYLGLAQDALHLFRVGKQLNEHRRQQREEEITHE